MKTIEEILEMMRIEMPFHLPERIKPYISEAMQAYSEQQVSIAVEKYKEQISLLETQEWISAAYEVGYSDAIERAVKLAPQILEELKGGEGK